MLPAVSVLRVLIPDGGHITVKITRFETMEQVLDKVLTVSTRRASITSDSSAADGSVFLELDVKRHPRQSLKRRAPPPPPTAAPSASGDDARGRHAPREEYVRIPNALRVEEFPQWLAEQWAAAGVDWTAAPPGGPTASATAVGAQATQKPIVLNVLLTGLALIEDMDLDELVMPERSRSNARGSAADASEAARDEESAMPETVEEEEEEEEVQEAEEETLTASLVSHYTKSWLGSTYTVYEVNVRYQNLQWLTEKRYSEFRRLHEKLKARPELKPVRAQIPSLPPRKLVGSLEPEFVEERAAGLAAYLEKLCATPALALSIPMLVFLGAMEDHEATKDIAHVKHTLTLERATRIVDAGDIILFRTNGVLQGLQRTFTSSSYDHVGVVIRYPVNSRHPNSLFIFEATMDGVKKYRFRSRLRAWHLSNTQLVLRRLIMDRDRKFRKTMYEFMAEMDGKKYGLNPVRMLRRVSDASKDSYFCSEVVAMAYKRAGLLPADRSSNSYFPADFGEHAQLALLGDAKLGDEIHLVFQPPAVLAASQVRSDGEDDPEDL